MTDELDGRVLAHIQAHPGTSGRGIRRALDARAELVVAALHRLERAGRVARSGPRPRQAWSIATPDPVMVPVVVPGDVSLARMEQRMFAKSDKDGRLAAAAERAEQLVESYTAEVQALELENEKAEARYLAGLADPDVSGSALSALRVQAEATRARLAARQQHLAQAVQAARAAHAAADRARLEAEIAAVAAPLAASDRVLEGLLAQLAAAWQARTVGPAARALALNAEIAAFQREHRRERETIAAPEPGLTENAYELCRQAATEVATLAQLRDEAAHPAPPRSAPEPAFLIGGDSPRALRQRKALKREAEAKRRGQ